MSPVGPEHIALGRAIRERRDELGMTQAKLAQAVGIHRSYVVDVEHGRRNLAYANIVKIAAALGLKPSELVGRAERFKSASS